MFIQNFKKPKLKPNLEKAFMTAYKNIYKFHSNQLSIEREFETTPGVHCSRIVKPIGILKSDTYTLNVR